MALHAPQLIVGARMLYLVWLPADPEAAAALVPAELQAAQGSPVFMNQYVVDDGAQTSNAASEHAWGACSLTYLGVDLAGSTPRTDAGPVVDALLRLLREHDPVRNGARRTGEQRCDAARAGRHRLVRRPWSTTRPRFGRPRGRAREARPRHRPAAVPDARRRPTRQRPLPVRDGRGRDVRGRVGRFLGAGPSRCRRCARPTRCR